MQTTVILFFQDASFRLSWKYFRKMQVVSLNIGPLLGALSGSLHSAHLLSLSMSPRICSPILSLVYPMHFILLLLILAKKFKILQIHTSVRISYEK